MITPTTTIARLTVNAWRQFRHVEIAFHHRLTIITGANGAGKSTLLNLINRHFGWAPSFVGTPTLKRDNAHRMYTADFWDLEELERLEKAAEEDPNILMVRLPHHVIGELEYTNGITTELLVPTQGVGYVYDVQFRQQQPVEGLHISSHRPFFNHQQVQSIPTQPRRRNEAFNSYRNLMMQRMQGGHTPLTPHHYMKETLIALATFGYGSLAVVPDPESAVIFEGFEEALRRMLPASLGFQRILVRAPEILLETTSGSFSIDAVSGGVSAIIELAWQIYMFEPTGKRVIVTMDEPENHLHPQLQKRVLPDLLQAFPNVQFIIATHSPFIVGSVPDSHVYVLDYDDSRRINSELLDTLNKAGSANEILRDVLGLDSTWPIWVTSELDQIVAAFAERPFDAPTIAEFRLQMDRIGMDAYFPETLAKLAAAKDGANDPAQ